MLDGARPFEIVAAVQKHASEHGWAEVSAWTLWRDRRWVERRWSLVSDRRMQRRRDAVLARMERLERVATSAGQYAAAAAALAWQARILGLLRPDGIVLLPPAPTPNTPLAEL